MSVLMILAIAVRVELSSSDFSTKLTSWKQLNLKLIIDLLDDYEGIGGYEAFRDDLGLMYFASLDCATGKLVNLQMIPTQIKCLRIQRASTQDILWLREVLNREGKRFGTRVQWDNNKILTLQKLG